jgi:hypothetical protein
MVAMVSVIAPQMAAKLTAAALSRTTLRSSAIEPNA